MNKCFHSFIFNFRWKHFYKKSVSYFFYSFLFSLIFDLFFFSFDLYLITILDNYTIILDYCIYFCSVLFIILSSCFNYTECSHILLCICTYLYSSLFPVIIYFYLLWYFFIFICIRSEVTNFFKTLDLYLYTC